MAAWIDGIWAAADDSVWVATTTGEAFVRVREDEVLERIDVDGFAIACCLDDKGNFYGTVAVSTNPEKTVFEAVYQPASHFWPLQLTETGLFVGLAALLVAFAAWWTHERTI